MACLPLRTVQCYRPWQTLEHFNKRIAAAAFNLPTFYENMTEEGDDHLLAWLPRCAAPDRLYEMYQNPETTVVVDGTREDGLADLSDLLIPGGLSLTDFNAVVRNTLLLMPAFAQIIDKVPQGVTDTDGIALIQKARPDLTGQDTREQWRIIRDWIGIFFQDKFEIAPASFITRPKPHT